MQIILYSNFSKKKNSTKQPSGGVTRDVKMKDECSVESPIFLIDGVDLSVNYVRWNDGYYFVDDLKLQRNNIYEIHCSIDPLATWRSIIGNSTQFIERSASAYDDKINDEFLTSEQWITNAGVATTDMNLDGTGCFIFRTASDNGINLFATNSLEMLGAIYSNETYGTTDTIIQSIVDSIGMSAIDASQYLLNVMWVPVAMSRLPGTILAGTQGSGIPLGFWEYTWPSEMGWTCKKLSEQRDSTSQDLVMPYSAYSDFRAYSPEFSRYTMYLPGVGTVNLNALDTKFSLGITRELDLISGGVAYIIRNLGGGNYVATFNGQLGVNIPMVSTNINSAGFLENVAGTIGAMVASGSAAGAVAAGVIGGVNAVKTLASEQGSINGYAGNIGLIKRQHQVLVNVEQYGSKDFPTSVAGRPLYEYRQINSLSGFIKCGGASIDIPGDKPNKDAVNSYLNGGFYYE